MIKITNNKEYIQIKRSLIATQLHLIDLIQDPKTGEKVHPALNASLKDTLVEDANQMMDLLIAYENKVNFTPSFIQESTDEIVALLPDYPQQGLKKELAEKIKSLFKAKYQNYIPEFPHLPDEAD